jgi:GNAT superfamily N-acetyltransferase
MNEIGGDQPFLLRPASPDDARVIAWHRARMFQDMGEISPANFDILLEEARRWTESALERGEYVGWLGVSQANPGIIAGGAGVQLRQVPPHPSRPPAAAGIAKGKHAIVLNVFTEPEWRRRGLATLLLRQLLDWAREKQLDSLLLHASADGRSLYERLGFVATNEMRFAGD